jgi:two-component system, OmpR family, response regulator RstA
MVEGDGARTNILLVEDDLELAGLIVERLEQESYRVEHVADGAVACQKIPLMRPDLVILDIMLPGKDGFEVCRCVRPEFEGPILILTARDDDLDQILGLELGADDFLTKPVRPRVLLARVRALLRRMERVGGGGQGVLALGELTIDAGRREARLSEELISLTTIEFDLLWVLAGQAGRVVSREELYRALYQTEYDGLDRSIDVYVSRLRKKLKDDPAEPHILKTVRGSGYLLAGRPQ